MQKEVKIETLKEILQLLKILKKSIKLKNNKLRKTLVEIQLRQMDELFKSFDVIPTYQDSK